MRISTSLIEAYQNLYEQRFCQSITTSEAEHQLLDLVELVRLITERKKNYYAK